MNLSAEQAVAFARRAASAEIDEPESDLARMSRLYKIADDMAEHLRGEASRLQELAYSPDGKEHRTVVFEQAAEIERLNELLRGVGANRYWEGRWRDEKEENDWLQGELSDIGRLSHEWRNRHDKMQAALKDAAIYIGESDPDFVSALWRKAGVG